MKSHYINAVTELLLQGREANAVLGNLARVLAEKGHTSIHASVLRGVIKELQRRREATAPTVVVAKSADASVYKEAIEASLLQLKSNPADVQFLTDESLIGGYIASHQGKLINRSYKEKLVSLYRAITK